MTRNPFLPKRPIRWQAGPAKGTIGIPALSVEFSGVRILSSECVYKKDPRGRKPKDKSSVLQNDKSISTDLHQTTAPRANPDAGKLNFCTGSFFGESNSGWGANLDMVGLAHGPVGCGVFTQTSRLNLPGFIQGIESFTAIHACTDLGWNDFEDGGDKKLADSLVELMELFPLANGITILSEDPVTIVDSNIKGVAKTKTLESGKLIIPRLYDGQWERTTAAGLRIAGSQINQRHTKSNKVALAFFREATGLVWIVSKLLADIGLAAVNEITGSSTSDMKLISKCDLVLGFAQELNVHHDFMARGAAQLMRQWFDIPLAWTCFVSPSATDASLRAIAAHFDSKTQELAEQVIAANRQKIEAVILRYRPRLAGKLLLHLEAMTEEQLEPYRLLGMRIGNANGWTGKTGVWRTPRLVCDPNNLSEKAIESYITEAKPDLVLCFGRSKGHGEYDWRKRGNAALPVTPLFDRTSNAYWGYDGFACFAAAIDRALNAPWRKLIRPPWPEKEG